MNAFYENRFYSSPLLVSAFYAKDNNYLAHWHLDVEMVFVLEGSIKVGINKDCRILNKGEIAICSSNDIHYYDSSNLHSNIAVVVFRPELIKNSVSWPEGLRFVCPFMDRKIIENTDHDEYKVITEAFIAITEEISHPKPYNELYINGKILEICALALRNFPTIELNGTKIYRRMPDIEKIQKVLKDLEDNYSSDISLEDISSSINLSTYYFSRLFKKYTGTNFKDYINRIRIDNAEKMIKSTSKSITDISFECGFNSVRTFNRNFKKIKGYTPSSTI